MNEFELIDAFFASITHTRHDVVLGIGDDAACLQIPPGKQLLVSADTLVAGVHFLEAWDAYDIATKAVMVNVSDIAAMGGIPAWMMLTLTLPSVDEAWLWRFSQGIKDTLAQFNIALIGGDTTRGPLSMTLTIHGLVDEGKAIRRQGAKVNDVIYVSGELGLASAALQLLNHKEMDKTHYKTFMNQLHKPMARVDYQPCLARYANAAIDISDGLSKDLNHICHASGVGAQLFLERIPVHPLVTQYLPHEALNLALSGGDDYELCFTVSPEKNDAFLKDIQKVGLSAYPIGVVEAQSGLRAKTKKGIIDYTPLGYHHF